MVANHQAVLEFASRAQHYPDRSTLMKHFAKVVNLFGYNSFIFTGLPKRGYDIAPLIICDHWPSGWTDRYREQNYFAEDPVGRWSLTRRRPFHWHTAQEAEGVTPLRLQIRGEAWDHGLADGIAYPLHGEAGAVVSLASEVTNRIDPLSEASIFLAVSYFKAAAEELEYASAPVPRPILTNREIEVLKWTAAGKSAWDTSAILSISESTVKVHRAAIRAKLGVATTTQAIAVALRRGIIPL
jgi:LuxR family quorum sensing-dependent transcriptional regulator